MPIENDSLVSDLTQLKRRQEQTISDIERLKEKAGQDDLADLEKIESDVWKTIIDIDEISRKRNADLGAANETNRVLFFRSPRPAKRETCGRIRF